MKKNRLQHIVSILVLLLLLAACKDDAKDNSTIVDEFEAKIVLSRGGVVDSKKEIRIIVSNSDRVKKVEYFINAEPIGLSEADRFAIEWDPYYFSDEVGIVTLDALITDVTGEIIFGPDTELNILSSSKQSLRLGIKNGFEIRNSDQATLTWSGLDDAEVYHVQMWHINDPGTLVIDQQLEFTELLVEGLSEGEYEWRVKAANQYENWGAWTDIQLLVITGPIAPQPLSPIQKDVIDDTFTPEISWHSSDHAVGYIFEIANDSDFSNLIVQSETTETSYQTASLSLGTYYWRVRAKNEFGYLGDWNRIYQFTITGPNPPNVISPTEGVSAATSSGVRLLWEAMNNEKYDIQTDTHKRFKTARLYSNVEGNSLIITDYGKGANYWRIRTKNSNGLVGDWSDVHMFTANIAPIPDGVTVAPVVISIDAAWTKSNSPYYIVGSTTLDKNVKLTIEPGTIVKFTDDAQLILNGKLISRGLVDDMITFTSAYERPSAGDWQGLKFQSRLISTFDSEENYLEGPILEFSNISYGGSSNSSAIQIKRSGPFINNNHISDNLNTGVFFKGIEPITISSNIFEFNKHTTGWQHNGAAILADSSGESFTLKIIGNLIKNNSARLGSIYIKANEGSAVISKNIFLNNIGIDLYVAYYTPNVEITRNTFLDLDQDIYSVVELGGRQEMVIENTFQEASFTDNSSLEKNLILANGNDQINNNNFINNSAPLNLEAVRGSGNIQARSNWWGASDPFSIEDLIYHKADNSKLLSVDYSSFLSAPDINAPISSPQNLHILSNDATSMEIIWNENLESDIAGYRVYRDQDGEWPYDEVIDVGNALMHTLENVDLSAGVYIGVSAYDTSYVETNDNPITRLNENQTAGNESLISELDMSGIQ